MRPAAPVRDSATGSRVVLDISISSRFVYYIVADFFFRSGITGPMHAQPPSLEGQGLFFVWLLPYLLNLLGARGPLQPIAKGDFYFSNFFFSSVIILLQINKYMYNIQQNKQASPPQQGDSPRRSCVRQAGLGPKLLRKAQDLEKWRREVVGPCLTRSQGHD